MRPSPSVLRFHSSVSSVHTIFFPGRSSLQRALRRPLDKFCAPPCAIARGLSNPNSKPASAQRREYHSGRRSPRRPVLNSSASTLGLLLLLSIGIGLGYSFARKSSGEDKEQTEPELAFMGCTSDSMAGEIAPGRPGNLTPEQEEKLRQLWQLVFQVCGVVKPENGTVEQAAPATAEKVDAAAAQKAKKSSRMSIFRRGRKESDADTTPAAAPPSGPPPSVILSTKEGDEDKYGQTKHFYDTLASQTPESIRATIWSMVKHDHPDALLLRFLRARKWDVEKALVMLVSTMSWRAQEMKVDEDIMRNGDAAAAEAEKDSSDPAKQRLGHDFLQQARIGKSFVHGIDKQGRPICYVRVRLHRQGEQLEESLERYTVYVIETCRHLLQPPVDTATIVFDMTGFSLANMDYTPVKFMIKCFEANYPESLGAVLVHKAPWVFQGIWRVIRGWLDPVVANKVHFTNNIKELEEFIAIDRIPKELEGQEDWEYKFVEPVPGENDKMKDAETRNRLLAARELLVKQFEEATLQWIQHPEGEKGAETRVRRGELATKLKEDYWNLDPYIRARSFYDRTGVLGAGGVINFYPQQKKLSEKVDEITNGVEKVALAQSNPVDTSADDVD